MPRRRPAASKTTPPLTPRAVVRIDRGNVVALSDAGADLLEQIHAAGSLSEAARRLHFSYRRAWLLLDSINRGWNQKAVLSATGGKKGGGAHLTHFGQKLLSAYRDLQLQLEHTLD